MSDGGLMGKIGSMVRRLTNGGIDEQATVDEQKALAFTQDRWNDLKNSYVVWHQSIWQSLLFYANQSWIDWAPEMTPARYGNRSNLPTSGSLALVSTASPQLSTP